MVYVNYIRKAPINRIEIKTQSAAEKPQEPVASNEDTDEKSKRGRKAKED